MSLWGKIYTTGQDIQTVNVGVKDAHRKTVNTTVSQRIVIALLSNPTTRSLVYKAIQVRVQLSNMVRPPHIIGGSADVASAFQRNVKDGVLPPQSLVRNDENDKKEQ